MSKFYFRAILSALFVFVCLSSAARIPVKVACIGDSITYGAGVEDRENNSYPVQLQRLLGSGYEVRNYGFSARVMVQTGDYPYMKENMYQDVKSFLPDICVIMLGTNDTKPQNWDLEGFRRDYNTMIQELKQLPSHPDIFLCFPPSVVTDRWGINEKLVVDGVMPVIETLALENWLDVIDTHKATQGMPQNYCDDGVHPNAGGASVLAKTVFEALRSNGYGPVPGTKVLFVGDSITDGNWGGNWASGRNHYDQNHLMGHGFPEMCAADYLARYPERNMRFLNRGISGDTMKMMAARWEKDVLAVHPDVISVLIGINDVKESNVDNFDFATWESTYRSLIEKSIAADPDVRFVLCTPFATDSSIRDANPLYERRHGVVERMTQIVFGIASDYGCTVVDSFSLADRLSSDVKTSDRHYWLWDGVHPTTAGHRKIADLWLKTTRKLLK